MAALDTLPPFKALIFDCDGTLVLSAGLHFTAFGQAIAQQGAVLPLDWYKQRMGLARHHLLSAFQQEFLPDLDLDRAIRESIEASLTVIEMCQPNPPVVALARTWFGRVPMAVASNAERVVVQAMLEACDLGNLFDPVISLSEAGVAKPDPRMFLMAAMEMGVAPEDCLVLEDSKQGMTAAARANIPAVDVRD